MRAMDQTMSLEDTKFDCADSNGFAHSPDFTGG